MAAEKRQPVIPSPHANKIVIVAKGVEKILPPVLSAADISKSLVSYAVEAEKAIEAATRLEVKDQASYDVATTVGASISAVLRNLEGSRKSYTSPLEDAKKRLIALFNGPGDRLTSSLDAIKRKMDAWRVAERARLDAAAGAERKRIADEAKTLAAAATAMGDAEGAKQIVADAAAIVVEPAKIVGTSAFGATTSERKLPTGAITDKRAFLTWALAEGPDIIDALDIGKTALNRLAKTLLEAKAAANAVPGFAFEYTESTGFRS